VSIAHGWSGSSNSNGGGCEEQLARLTR